MPTTTTHYGPMTWVGTSIDLTPVVARLPNSFSLDIAGWINVVGSVHATQYVFQLRFWDTVGAPIGGVMYSAECGSGGTIHLAVPFPSNAGYWAVNVVSNSLSASTDTAEIDVGSLWVAATFYRNFDVHAGLSCDGTAHHQFGFPMSGAYDTSGAPISGGIDWITGLTVAPDNPLKLYAWATDPADSRTHAFSSLDAGASWTRRGLFPAAAEPATDQRPDANGTSSAPSGRLWVANHSDPTGVPVPATRYDGVWTSSDNGATWTRILACEGTCTRYTTTLGVQTLPRGCFALALGASKLWFVWEVSAVISSSPYPSPPPGYATYRFETANLDGSGRTTIAELTLHAESTYDSTFDRNQFPLRPWGDAFALVTKSSSTFWRVDGAGGITSFAVPTDGLGYDIVPLGPTTYLAQIWFQTANQVGIYRTVDSGTTWTLIRTLTGPEYAGWGSGQLVPADAFGCWTMGTIPGSSDVLVMGGQGTIGPGGTGLNETAPLTTWYSTDAGLTFTAVQDVTAPVDPSGYWMYGHQLGIASPTVLPTVAPSGRLVSIVG